MNEFSEQDLIFLRNNKVTIVEKSKFICSSCNCPISGLPNVKQHLKGYLHRNIIETKQQEKAAKNAKPAKKNANQRQQNDVAGRNKLLPNPFSTKKDPQVKQQKTKTHYTYEQILTDSEDMKTIIRKKFVCRMCDMQCSSESDLMQHLLSSMPSCANRSDSEKSVKSTDSQPSSAKPKTEPKRLPYGGIALDGFEDIFYKESNGVTKSEPHEITQNLKTLQLGEVAGKSTGVQNGLQNPEKFQRKVVNQNGLQKSEIKLDDDYINRIFGTGIVVKKTNLQVGTKLSKNYWDEIPNQVQNNLEKPEPKPQPKEQNPLLKQIESIASKQKDENLLFLYDAMFLSSGNQNVYHSDDTQKLLDCISVIFIRNDTMNCVVCAKQLPNDVPKLYEHVQGSEHEENMKSILENHEQFVDFPDQFSDFRLAKELMCEVSDDEIDCFVCTVKLPNNDFEVGRHVETAKHKTNRAKMFEIVEKRVQDVISNLADNWYNIDHLSCKICGKNFVSEIKFFNHINLANHKGKLPAKGDCFTDFCIPCSSLWLEQENPTECHSESHKHEFNLKTERYLVPEMPVRAKKALEDVEGLAENVLRFVQKENLDIVRLAMQDLAESPLKKVAIPLEEIELAQVPGCLDYTLIAKDRGSSDENYKLVNMLNITQKWQQLFRQKETYSIMLFNNKYAFQCRVIFDNVLLEATRLLRCYFTAYKMCEQTMLFLQSWLSYCNFDLNQISSFVLGWFVVFYLQNVHNYPSLQQAVSLRNGIILGNIKKKSLREYVKGFFEFYATFDFKTLVLSPLLGKTFKKIDYFNLRPIGEWKYVLNSPVVLENPLKEERMTNLTDGMTKQTLRTFRHYCAESLNLMS